MKFTDYIPALRLRTVPLSLSGVLLGAMLAAAEFHVDWKVVPLLAMTAASLQILSNLEASLRNMIRVQIALVVVFGLLMLHVSFGSLFMIESFVMMLLGYAAIRAAMKHTMGPHPYGYWNWGDLGVFVFYGIVAVIGGYYICSHSLGTKLLLLPAVCMGAFSVGVLNVNNIGDMRAKICHTCLIVTGWVAMTVYSCLRFPDPWHYLYVLTLPLFIWHLADVWKHPDKDPDRFLPLLVISVSAFALLAGIGFLVFLF